MKNNSILFCLLLCLLQSVSYAKDINLLSSNDYYILLKDEMEIIIDSTNSWSFNEILTPNKQRMFGNSQIDPYNEFFEGTYWIRIKIINTDTTHKEWILESHNYRINNILLYLPITDKSYLKKQAGDEIPFHLKEVQHKNIHFILNQPQVQSGYYYIRYKSGSKAPFQFVIRSLKHFSADVSMEYFSFGMYYGMLLIIGIYSFFLYLSFQDKALLFYLGYLFFTALFSMCHDGLSFQFLWPTLPYLNNYVFIISVMCMTVFLFLYTCYLLMLPAKYPWIITWIIRYIIVRIILYIVCLIWFPHIRHILYIDLLPLVLSYALAIECYLKGFKPALYIIIGHSFICIAYILGLLRLFNVISPTFLNVYTINIAVIIDMLLLSLVLGRRIRLLKDKEFMHLQLEEKVRERAEIMMSQKDIIKDKVKELDTYIYRTAHDISGPLKSIQGLTNLGMLDPSQSDVYFKHIHETTIKMNEVLQDLYKISEINNSQLDIKEVHFLDLYKMLLASFTKSMDFEHVKINFEIDQKNPFYSDGQLILKIFYNITQNAIQYRDKNRNSNLHIKIQVDEKLAVILFMDNGIGIPIEYHKKIFQLFFHLDSAHKNTGLGLYSAKLLADKLSSTLNVKESSRQGTTFELALKNLTS